MRFVLDKNVVASAVLRGGVPRLLALQIESTIFKV